MTEEPELPLAGLDAERPLPPELRARLEAALLAAVAGGLPVPADAESLDAPRPLPPELRARLESALLASAPVTSGAASTEPAHAEPTAAGAVTPLRRRRRVLAAWSAVAAVLLLVVAAAGLVGRGSHGPRSFEAVGGPTATVETPASLPSGAGVTTGPAAPAATGPAAPATTGPTLSPAPRAAVPFPPASPTTASPVTAPGRSGQPLGPGGGGGSASPRTASPPTSPSGSGGSAPASSDPGPPPPFYNAPAPGNDGASQAPAAAQPGNNPPSYGAAPAPSGGGSGTTAPQPTTANSGTAAPAGPSLRIGIIGGDAGQEAGFRAYVDRLNQSGGVRGHGLELVAVGPGSPASGTIATVNLGSQPVAGPGGPPSWAAGPLLETLSAPENLLTGGGAVFDFASPPERQGHLVADALFPSSADAKTTAVIYAPSAPGPLRDVVPDAIKAVLTARGVSARIVTYDTAVKKPLAPADAAFVSLDPAAARAWVAQAKSEGYRPAQGVGGIYSLADPALAADLPDGTRVISPYVVPAGDEGQAIRSGAGGTSASVLHGWADAKALAAAVWRTGADTPAELQSALEGLAGWSSGLAPAYETRSGTRSRTPEGVLIQVESGAFVQQGGFRRDPY